MAAVVVLFHPTAEVVQTLCARLSPQVKTVLLVDNTPGSQGAVYGPSAGANVIYAPLGENLGIAAAQNFGIEHALAARCSHVLLLDQDSLLPPDAVAELLQAERHLLEQDISLAAVGPVFIDRKTGLPGKAHYHRWFRLAKPFVDLAAVDPVETDWLIASGSLIRISVLKKVGLMREDLFIDAVDTEWGLRARSLGLASFVAPRVRIEHSIGDAYVRLFGVSVILHNRLRNYYIARNWLYLLRVKSMGRHWRSGVLIRLTKFLLVHSWFTRDRLAMVRVFARALSDGAHGRLGRYIP